jgi:dolichyl-phosphate beta-glucosyltransferase
MDLSIVIPAYDESTKIARDISEAAGFLEAHKFTGQIIVVDDGSRDNTAEAAKNAWPDARYEILHRKVSHREILDSRECEILNRESRIQNPESRIRLNVIRYETHRGKGYAVRTGIKQSKGEYVMFADSGSCVPYEDTLRGLQMLKNDTCDIAHGSRKMRGCHIEKTQSLYRRICSRMFHWFVIHDMKIPAEFTDTQCGFKMYKGNVARHLYGEAITDGFSFDIEIIMRAQQEGYRIKEFPIDWTCDRDSRLSPTRSSWQVLTELLKVRRILKVTKVRSD